MSKKTDQELIATAPERIRLLDLEDQQRHADLVAGFSAKCQQQLLQGCEGEEPEHPCADEKAVGQMACAECMYTELSDLP